MIYYEFFILDFIQNHLRTVVGDFLMPLISKLGNAGIIWILMAIALLITKKYRKAGFAMVFALILDLVLCNLFLKPLVARVRPCDVNVAIHLLISRPTGFSFPSGHTAASFASVSALYFSRNWLWKPALILAVLIAFSRLYLYVHYPSDVLAGAIIGIIVGFIGQKAVNSR